MLFHVQSKNIGVEIFKSMTMFDGVMDRLLSVNCTADTVLSLIKFNLLIFYSEDVIH